MVAQTTVGGIEHWLKEEMKLWHALPLFLALIPVVYVVAWPANVLVPPPSGTAYTMLDAIAGAGLFAGFAMGWVARREYDA